MDHESAEARDMAHDDYARRIAELEALLLDTSDDLSPLCVAYRAGEAPGKQSTQQAHDAKYRIDAALKASGTKRET